MPGAYKLQQVVLCDNVWSLALPLAACTRHSWESDTSCCCATQWCVRLCWLQLVACLAACLRCAGAALADGAAGSCPRRRSESWHPGRVILLTCRACSGTALVTCCSVWASMELPLRCAPAAPPFSCHRASCHGPAVFISLCIYCLSCPVPLLQFAVVGRAGQALNIANEKVSESQLVAAVQQAAAEALPQGCLDLQASRAGLQCFRQHACDLNS